MNTKKLTLCAVLIALSVVLLYLSTILPTGRLTLIAIAGMLPAIAVISGGLKPGFLVYLATSLLGLILAPSGGIMYLLIFGHYPMLKQLIERLNRLWLEWIIKIVIFNALLGIAMAFFSAIVSGFFSDSFAGPLIFIAGNIAFVIYDICFTGVIDVMVKKYGKGFKL